MDWEHEGEEGGGMIVWRYGRHRKTDWTDKDRFELEDYNRIKNNIYYLLGKGVCVVF